MQRNKTLHSLPYIAQQEPQAQITEKSVVGSLNSLLKIVGISILENVWWQYFFTLKSYGIMVIIDWGNIPDVSYTSI